MVHLRFNFEGYQVWYHFDNDKIIYEFLAAAKGSIYGVYSIGTMHDSTWESFWRGNICGFVTVPYGSMLAQLCYWFHKWFKYHIWYNSPDCDTHLIIGRRVVTRGAYWVSGYLYDI